MSSQGPARAGPCCLGAVHARVVRLRTRAGRRVITSECWLVRLGQEAGRPGQQRDEVDGSPEIAYSRHM